MSRAIRWELPLAGDAERGLYDLRFKTFAQVIAEPDSRIVLVVYNDETLRQLGKRSPLDRRMLARALRVLDEMEPQAIGIDILIDQAQPEDEELIAAFRSLRTPTYLAFATHAANPAQIADWQEEWMRRLFARVGSGRLRPASIRLDPDVEDGVIRRWTLPDADLRCPTAHQCDDPEPSRIRRLCRRDRLHPASARSRNRPFPQGLDRGAGDARRDPAGGPPGRARRLRRADSGAATS